MQTDEHTRARYTARGDTVEDRAKWTPAQREAAQRFPAPEWVFEGAFGMGGDSPVIFFRHTHARCDRGHWHRLNGGHVVGIEPDGYAHS
jgi:hypothetical protein